VAKNVVSVPAREIAAAPVSHMVAVEPARASVLGAGRPVANRPPAAVTSRQVVARRTPAAMPRSFDQRQAQAGGHLSQPPLVRQEPAGRSAMPANQPSNQPSNQGARQSEEGFRPFGQPNGGNNAARPQASGGGRSAPASERQPTQQWSHPLARPVAPVQERNPEQEQQQEQKFHNWQQQRPAPASRPAQQHSTPPSHQERPKK
jgi:hypothetical protein